MTVQTILVLGGGSAGFRAALTLKRKLPLLTVRVIGVGEGTTIAFLKHFFVGVRNAVGFVEPLEARRALDVKQCLEAIRKPGMKRT